MKLRCRDPHPSTGDRRGFSLIELIGVLAIMSVLAGVLLPNLVRHEIQARWKSEESNLENLGRGLLDSIRATAEVPGASVWAGSIAAKLGQSMNQVGWVTPADGTSARVYLVHPGFTPATAANPIYRQTSSGAGAVTHARVMVLSCTKPGLALPVTSGRAADTPANAAAFNAIWDWSYDPSTKAVPAGWPAAWGDHGEYLHVKRLDLTSMFYPVTFSILDHPGAAPCAKFNNLATYSFGSSRAQNAYYLRGTLIRLFKHDSPTPGSPPSDPAEQDIAHSLEGPVNFVYEGGAWRIR